MDAQVTHKAKAFLGRGVFLFCVLILADQLSKQFAARVFRNYVFAFSLPLPVWLIYLIYAAVLFSIAYYAAKNYKNFTIAVTLAWVLILTGAVCNVGERLFLGYVRDFIYISFFRWVGVYNLADFYIILGIIILLAASKLV